jgi:AcrR family transcriptional regulator
MPARPGAGRPTARQAEQRHEQMLDSALAIFLDKGFEQTTMESIAASVGMTKRTVYARYADKQALFRATIHRAFERWTVPIDTLRAVETPDLRETLTAIGLLRMRSMISPGGLLLQRLINAESYRFPEILLAAYREGTEPAVAYLGDLFRRFAARGQMRADKPSLLAQTFLSLVVGGSTRNVILGLEVDEAETEARVRFSVGLFLDGVVPR